MVVNMDLDIVVQKLWPQFANKTGLSKNGSYTLVQDDRNMEKLLEEFRKGLLIYKTPSSQVLMSLYIPIFLVAFFGNLTILFVVLPNKHMRNVTNWFLVNLAVADLLVTSVCIPMAIGLSIYKVWIYGGFMCKLSHYLQGVAVSASIVTLTVMALERYLAIRHPITFRRVSTSQHARAVITVVWITAFTIMVPLALVRDVEITDLKFFETLPFCTERWVYVEKPIYMTCLMVFVYVIPGCVITLSYSFIGCQLLITDEGLHRSDSRAVHDQTRALMHSRRKVARMLMCLAILFAFCWMPYNICSLYIDLQTADNMDVDSLTALPFTLCLGHSNSALNPVLYWFMNKSFRKAVRRKFGCRRRRSAKSFKSPTPLNVMVHCTKENGKMKASVQLKRPKFRLWSRSNSSTSLRYSRTASSFKSRRTDLSERPNSPGKSTVNIPLIEIHNDDPSRLFASHKATSRDKREIMCYHLSIPTTINEETSRFRTEITPSPMDMKSFISIPERTNDTCDSSQDSSKELTVLHMSDLTLTHDSDEKEPVERTKDGAAVLVVPQETLRAGRVRSSSVSDCSCGASRVDYLVLPNSVPKSKSFEIKLNTQDAFDSNIKEDVKSSSDNVVNIQLHISLPSCKYYSRPQSSVETSEEETDSTTCKHRTSCTEDSHLLSNEDDRDLATYMT
ncbi:orexin/Hypocretin receptor type 1-like isoform X2 [Lineus longissimus]|uniref:orexin/Hypocretin receptor type 1-like isoform X2 n=1 Tax=Lineus longissimus TaxID=88925 RepID=UPI002B4CFB4B